jgi:hypothetical protein
MDADSESHGTGIGGPEVCSSRAEFRAGAGGRRRRAWTASGYAAGPVAANAGPAPLLPHAPARRRVRRATPLGPYPDAPPQAASHLRAASPQLSAAAEARKGCRAARGSGPGVSRG